MKKRRHTMTKAYGAQALGDNDPLTGVANLFDLFLVFIVGLLMTLFSAYHLQDLFSGRSRLTIMKQPEDGRKVEAMRVGPEQAKGRGVRLGTAYRLEDGTTIDVAENAFLRVLRDRGEKTKSSIYATMNA